MKQSVALSLVPWAAFLVAIAVAEPVHWLGVTLTAPFYLGFVALPSFLPIFVTRHWPTKAAVVVVMTVAAGVAGVAMATSQDAQAGLAVLIVAYVAIPLTGLVWLAQTVVSRRLDRSGDSVPPPAEPPTVHSVQGFLGPTPRLPRRPRQGLS